MAGRLLAHPGNNVQSMPGDVYMSGLLHSIGKLVLVLHRPADFGLSLEMAQQRGLHFTFAVWSQDTATYGDSPVTGLNSAILADYNATPAW